MRKYSLKGIVDGMPYYIAKQRFSDLANAIDRAEKLHNETGNTIEIHEFVIGEGDKLVRTVN